MYQRNRNAKPHKAPRDEDKTMALTFGTLLSSQGADTHHHDPPRPIRGNRRYITRSVSLSQMPSPARIFPLGREASRPRRAWGKSDDRFGAPARPSGRPARPAARPVEQLRH